MEFAPSALPAYAIPAAEAGTLDGLFRIRVARTPKGVAYRDFNHAQGVWRELTWEQVDGEVGRWQAALEREGLKPGDRVAVMLRNCAEWVIFDQAALGLGLVVVPLYTMDRPENVAYIVADAGCKVLLFETLEQWRQLSRVRDEMSCVQRLLSVRTLEGADRDPRLVAIADWLPAEAGPGRHLPRDPEGLATIVYTSGTTGRPKGVMLSHRNILSNTEASLSILTPGPDDVFLSFLPLSHTLERTAGYYLTVMCGSTVVFARSIPQLGEDLQTARPTILISVPRIYEKIYATLRAKLDEGPPARKRLFELAVNVGWARFEWQQGRGPWRASLLMWPLFERLVAGKLQERLGGRLRVAISGGAALSADVSRIFIALGVTVLQGYGLTETSPVACANRPGDNLPASVGPPIPGVEVKLGENNALFIRGPNIMMGYWKNEEATRAMIGPDGWLNSGDTARIDARGHVFITGRIKEIIVMSNGEKVPPVDMEAAIMRDSLFDQIMLVGEGKPYLSALAVLNPERWAEYAAELGVDPADPAVLQQKKVMQSVIARIGRQTRDFPGYAQVRRVTLSLEPWTIDNGLLTPTLKLKRAKVMEKFNEELDRMYASLA